MDKKNLVVVGIIALIVVGYFGYTKSVQNRRIADTPLERPLYISGASNADELTAEQRAVVAEYKKKILARVKSTVPLTEIEKGILSISISTNPKNIPGMIIADQHLFRFTQGEIEIIKSALEA